MSDPIVRECLANTEVAALESSVPTIIRMCSALSGYALQPTLIHVDLHAGNALMHERGVAIIDWSEACIAHPFMDAFMVYNEQDDVVRARMRDAYLALWADFESIDRLRELWSRCGVVHAVHHAASYRSMLHHIPNHARNDLADTLPFLLRKALRFLRQPA